ncbi:MAG: fused MFS/spermidine synthase [Acidobacteria bacterium]|nr:fused MFS/spermidine synthase [Acidobacteriota bacterium]
MSIEGHPESFPPADDAPDPPQDRAGTSRTLLLANALVFASSTCIMVLEIVATRLIAANLGASLYTWTSVIGVILAGISIGNFCGGKIADRHPPKRVLPMLFLAASVLSFSVLWLNHYAESWWRPESVAWPGWVLFNVMVIFLLPAMMLGTIGPIVAKMALDEGKKTGSTMGNIYAWAAAGSIFGTFLTGFVLIELIGTRAIVTSVAGVLAMIGLGLASMAYRSGGAFISTWLVILGLFNVVAFGSWPWAQELGVFLLLRPDHSGLVYFDESNYFSIQVYEAPDIENARILALDNLVHSYVSSTDVTHMIYDYETIYAAIVRRLAPPGRPLRSLFIGGGGFVFPRYMEAVHPIAGIDVAEIDPAVKRAANLALYLPPDDETEIKTYTMDARNLVDDLLRGGAEGSYDFIFGDAFNDLSVPYHLTTLEFTAKLGELLKPDGVYMINIIDIYTPGLGRFLGSFVDTSMQNFAYVYVFSSTSDGPTEDRDTFIVACSMRPLDIHDLGSRPGDDLFEGVLFAWAENGVLGGQMQTVLERGGGLILTDDFAPVDNLLAPILGSQ